MPKIVYQVDVIKQNLFRCTVSAQKHTPSGKNSIFTPSSR